MSVHSRYCSLFIHSNSNLVKIFFSDLKFGPWIFCQSTTWLIARFIFTLLGGFCHLNIHRTKHFVSKYWWINPQRAEISIFTKIFHTKQFLCVRSSPVALYLFVSKFLKCKDKKASDCSFLGYSQRWVDVKGTWGEWWINVTSWIPTELWKRWGWFVL